jgi:uroporphyrinogen decarboxylase
MNGMARLIAAIKGEKADRIPVFCNLLDQGAKELGMTIEEYFSKGEYVAEAQVRMQKKYGFDNVWSLFYVGKEAELLGCKKMLYVKDGPPNVEDFVIKNLNDIHQLEVPKNVAQHPAFAEELNCLRLLKNEVGSKVPICAYISSAMTLPALLMGMEKWMELLFFGPETERQQLLTTCHEFFVKEVKAYREGGANVIVYSNPFGSTDTVPMKYFLEHSLPWIEKDIKAVGTEGLVYYCGTSRFNKVIDTVFKRTGLGTYYLSPLDDIGEGKRIIAGRALTCGVINDIKLIDWTNEEIRQEVQRLIRSGMPGGKFLFGTGVMPLGISEEKIRVMLEAAYEFGSYGQRDDA